MTEEEWRTCETPQAMLQWLQEKAIGTDRKYRLAACAFARRVWRRLMREPSAQDAIVLMEKFADGLATEGERYNAWRGSWGNWGSVDEIPYDSSSAESQAVAWILTQDARDAVRLVIAQSPDTQSQPALLRCIFGSPGRPVTLNPAWLTPTVSALALTVYQKRSLPSGHLGKDRLAILADALEDAGCQDPQILEHCRGKGPHVRGCWCVDLLTGRS
jgi:hypothetical protein